MLFTRSARPLTFDPCSDPFSGLRSTQRLSPRGCADLGAELELQDQEASRGQVREAQHARHPAGLLHVRAAGAPSPPEHLLGIAFSCCRPLEFGMCCARSERRTLPATTGMRRARGPRTCTRTRASTRPRRRRRPRTCRWTTTPRSLRRGCRRGPCRRSEYRVRRRGLEEC